LEVYPQRFVVILKYQAAKNVPIRKWWRTMDKKEKQNKRSAQKAENDENADLPGYPLYPAKEDIFRKEKEEKDIDPEDPSALKDFAENDKAGKNNEKDFSDDPSGSDLDVPGSELDDEKENIGNEDEENNYYSLGGDDHSDLDEDKGE
jgi:hypothetical protein